MRLNTEINPTVMPIGWKDVGDKYKCFELYISREQKGLLIYKFGVYRKQANKKEIVCFLLSNYMAYEQKKAVDPIAHEIIKYGKWGNCESGYFSSYTIGSIPECFKRQVVMFVKNSNIRHVNTLLYFLTSAFYNAPDRLVSKMCQQINDHKHPEKKNRGSHIILKTFIPESDYRMLMDYSLEVGMSVGELLKQVLTTVCVSKKERETSDTPLLRVFNLYRIMMQSGKPYPDGNTLISICYTNSEAKYLKKFISRRKIKRSELLRMAVRAFIHVVSKKQIFLKRSQYQLELPTIEDDYDYLYEKMAKRDYAISIYSFK